MFIKFGSLLTIKPKLEWQINGIYDKLTSPFTRSPGEEETKETGTMDEATREKVCEVIKIDDSVAEKELLDNYIKVKTVQILTSK